MRIALAFVLLFAATGAAAQPAAVQIRAGHATLALTRGTYGHLLDAQATGSPLPKSWFSADCGMNRPFLPHDGSKAAEIVAHPKP
jgi:hypothetical protein